MYLPQPVELYHVLVDTVWTVAFLKYRRWWIGHPDVIRDVRKKALVKPRIKEGVKYSFKLQKALLEFWLVVLNLLDYVKDFLAVEFRKELLQYHELALKVFRQLTRRPVVKIDWDALERFLTRDLRQKQPIAALGTTSEFQFYSSAADNAERIFFAMDIRDLGVALMLVYEKASEDIEHEKPDGVKLMEKTFQAADPINEQRRFTYDKVLATFRKYHGLLAQGSTGVQEPARKAFGELSQAAGNVPAFEGSVQLLLGGDEVFIAAHPYLARFEHNIVRDLDRTPLEEGTLNVRTAVSYSRSADAQNREATQLSHSRAMKLADLAPNLLKQLERTERRIERLIEKLELNPKKKDLAPAFRKKLESLGLTKLFARVNYGKTGILSRDEFGKLLRKLSTGTVLEAVGTGRVQLVDFDGQVIDAEKRVKDAAKLENDVRAKVGGDNYHVDPPPVTQLPKWIEKLLEMWSPKDPNKQPWPPLKDPKKQP